MNASVHDVVALGADSSQHVLKACEVGFASGLKRRKSHREHEFLGILSFLGEPAQEDVVIERPAPTYVAPSQTIIWNNSYRLDDRDRAVIANYYAYHARYKPVLSGPQPIIYMGEPVPPNAYLEAAPYDLMEQLQPMPEGFRYVLFGDNLLLIDPQGVVLDFAAL